MSHRIGDIGKVPLTGSERKAEADMFSCMNRTSTKGVAGRERRRHRRVVRLPFKQRLP